MKKYGIRGTLPKGDPMAAPHLLGESWGWTRWYDSKEKRDAAYEEMMQPFLYYRRGDRPTQSLEKIEEGA